MTQKLDSARTAHRRLTVKDFYRLVPEDRKRISWTESFTLHHRIQFKTTILCICLDDVAHFIV